MPGRKHDYIYVCVCVCEIWILLLLLISLKLSFIKYNYKETEFTLAKVFLLPEETQPMLCCVITHLMSGWYGDGETTSPGSIVITAAFVPRTNGFHPILLASLSHLVPLQTLTMRNWHLAARK